MKINQQGRISGRRWKIIKRLIRSIAPEQIVLAAKSSLRVAAARGVSFQVRRDRSHTAARRILPLAFGQRPIAPVRGIVWHVGYGYSVSRETILQDGRGAVESRSGLQSRRGGARCIGSECSMLKIVPERRRARQM